MASLESIFSKNASQVLPPDLVREWTNEFRNMDQKYRDEIKSLKAKNNQLEAKVKALTEENEKMKTELAKDSAVEAVKNMEVLLKELETRLSEKVQSTVQQSTIILESINKKHEDTENRMRQHTKTIKDTIIASTEVIKSATTTIQDNIGTSTEVIKSKTTSILADTKIIKLRGEIATDDLRALRCMQILSDSRTGSQSHQKRIQQNSLCLGILEVFVKNTITGDEVEYPFVYLHKDKFNDYSVFNGQMMGWGIDLSDSRLTYVEGCGEHAKQTPFKSHEWFTRLVYIRRVEISWNKSEKTYEVACFDSVLKDS
ncbi:hypothetical protein BZA77DRAFT_361755 [Pyronema omphalodes]|nr:hypothetical protein BZA77DRAFT_361755 [Pyronema omphalodes]